MVTSSPAVGGRKLTRALVTVRYDRNRDIFVLTCHVCRESVEFSAALGHVAMAVADIHDCADIAC